MPAHCSPLVYSREKLHQPMYKKLKIYIMKQRCRRAEALRHHADLKRRRLEREEAQQRLAQKNSVQLEKIKQELDVLDSKLLVLRADKKLLFNRFKHLAHEEAELKEKIKKENTAQITSGSISHSSNELKSSQVPENNAATNSTHSAQGAAAGMNFFHSSVALPTASGVFLLSGGGGVDTSSANNLNLNRRSIIVPPSSLSQQASLLNKLPSNVIGLPSNFHHPAAALRLIQQQQQQQQQGFRNLLTAPNAQYFAPSVVSTSSHNHVVGGNSVSITSAKSASTPGNSSLALNLPNNVSHLNAAPTSYRGSITTGQSAQQIQRLVAQQQQFLVGGGNNAASSYFVPSTNKSQPQMNSNAANRMTAVLLQQLNGRNMNSMEIAGGGFSYLRGPIRNNQDNYNPVTTSMNNKPLL